MSNTSNVLLILGDGIIKDNTNKSKGIFDFWSKNPRLKENLCDSGYSTELLKKDRTLFWNHWGYKINDVRNEKLHTAY